MECAFFGKEAKFHHVGLAVRSIREVYPLDDVFVDPTQGVSLAFFMLGGIRIELLEPVGHNSPIARSLRLGVKLLHLCYEVPDLEEAIKTSRSRGFHSVRAPIPAPAHGNRRIAWVFSKQYGLFELLESYRNPRPSGKDVL